MKHLLYGEDQASSYLELGRLISSWEGEVKKIYAEDLNATSLYQQLDSPSLFNNSTLYVVSFGTSKPDKQKISQLLSPTVPIIVYVPQKLDQKVVGQFTQFGYLITEVKTPADIFNFLDGLKPGVINLPRSFRLLLRKYEPEYILFMIVRQFRLMIFPDLCPYPWMSAKMQRQAKLFSSERLTILYKNLLTIDYKTKTGGTRGGLKSEMEMFLASL